jgi:periplasmic divalent cation tolerance protein
MAGYVQVISTIDKVETAKVIADHLIGEKLAACVQIAGPVKSVYRWKGKVENADEWQIIVKTRSPLYRMVEAAIRKLHPYEVPEIIVLPIISGGKDYLKWIDESTKNRRNLS